MSLLSVKYRSTVNMGQNFRHIHFLTLYVRRLIKQPMWHFFRKIQQQILQHRSSTSSINSTNNSKIWTATMIRIYVTQKDLRIKAPNTKQTIQLQIIFSNLPTYATCLTCNPDLSLSEWCFFQEINTVWYNTL